MPGASIALEAGAKEAQLAHGLNQLPRKAAIAIALLDDGNYIVFDELASSIARQQLIARQQPVKLDEINPFKFERHTAGTSECW